MYTVTVTYNVVRRKRESSDGSRWVYNVEPKSETHTFDTLSHVSAYLKSPVCVFKRIVSIVITPVSCAKF